MKTKHKLVSLYLPRLGGINDCALISQAESVRMGKDLRYVCSTWPDDGLGNEKPYDILRVSNRRLMEQPELTDYVAVAG